MVKWQEFLVLHHTVEYQREQVEITKMSVMYTPLNCAIP